MEVTKNVLIVPGMSVQNMDILKIITNSAVGATPNVLTCIM